MNWHHWICEKQNETVTYLLHPKNEYFILFIYIITVLLNAKKKKTKKLKQKGKGKKRDDRYVDPFCILTKHYGGLKKKKKKKQDHQL